jgi:hypothetical protein
VIEIISSTACSSCQQLEVVLAKNDITFREINIKTLCREELAEIESSAILKLVYIRCEGGASSMAAIMSTPMVRYYSRGNPIFMFPIDLFDHGQVRIEALAAIKAIAGV